MNDSSEDDKTVARPGLGAVAAGPLQAGRKPRGGDGHPQGLRAGSRMGDFEILRQLGDGGFSIVYLAREESLDRQVALKEYMPSSMATRLESTEVVVRSEHHQETFDAGMRSFINEAKLLARFDHPSLVKVHRFWEANGTAYMVMPFYEGVTLKQTILALPEPPDEAWIRTLVDQLIDALAVIHAEHCYHRDIAPDNIILLKDAKPVLLDFGAARRVIGDMTQALTVILKQGYAPVEQYAELPGLKQGTWTDVYALGAVVHWIITGRTPPLSVGRSVRETYRPLAETAAGRYSPRFLAAIDRALGVLPEQRTQTVEALRQDLGTVPRTPAIAPSPPRRPRYVVPVAAAAAIALAVAAGWWASSGRDARPPPVSASPATGPASAPASVPAAPIDAPVPAAPVEVPVPVAPPPQPSGRSESPSPADASSSGSRAQIPAPAVPNAALPDRVPRKPSPPPSRADATATKSEARRSNAERATPDPQRANQAECGRILLSQSSGADSPALAERYRALGCR